ncbi:jg21056 [Pararge aegeria aegeria]|uniref:Jg21056 protein n=2 Tax=Pararge aegeria TaxID=116150 RepID=A0A8S4RUX9_9NEOP|nr:jg21056 [Pararge aegeria aegeria]
MSPLQKARRALRIALQKAAQDLLVLNKPKSDNKYEYDVIPDEYCADEENVELEWLITKNTDNENGTTCELTQPDTVNTVKAENTMVKYRDIPQESLMDFSEDGCPQTNNFSTQFLSMPDLEQNGGTSGVELLAEFNIGSEIDQDIIKKTIEKQPECNSLNCVLPSVSNEHIDEVSMLEKHNEDMNHYNNEWDQMFNDMMSNKSSNQEGVSNLRELYSQISQTIDLLNS